MVKENCIDNINQQYYLNPKLFLYQSRLKSLFPHTLSFFVSQLTSPSRLRVKTSLITITTMRITVITTCPD